MTGWKEIEPARFEHDCDPAAMHEQIRARALDRLRTTRAFYLVAFTEDGAGTEAILSSNASPFETAALLYAARDGCDKTLDSLIDQLEQER